MKQSNSSSKVNTSLYRKPNNLYCYIPWRSNSATATKHAVIDAELHRINRICCSSADIACEQYFLREKLALRGFPTSVFHARLKRFSEPRAAVACSAIDARIIPFKLPYGDKILQLDPVGAIRKHSWMLEQKVQRVRFVNCFLAAPNLFRLRYSRFLGTTN